MNPPMDTISGSEVELVELVELVEQIDLVEQRRFQGCCIEMPGGNMLGETVLRLVTFQGKESVSDLFEYQLELHSAKDNPSEAGVLDSLAFSQIIGRPITVAIGINPFENQSAGQDALLLALMLRPGDEAEGAFSLFNGIVASFAIEAPGIYRVAMRPAAWRMGLTNHYRIFSQKSVSEVLEQLCLDHRVKASFDGLTGSANIASTRVQDWLQAGESDLEFMRRLMAKAHVFYYFTHSAGQHIMVFDNQPAYPPALSDNQPLRYTYTAMDELGMHQSDVVSNYNYQQSMGISGVEGVFTLQTEAWDVSQPGEPLATFNSFRANSRPDPGELAFKQYKIVQYGFSDTQVGEFAQSTELAMHTANVKFSGASTCPAFRAGHQFSMNPTPSDYTNSSVRPELSGVGFVLTQVQHSSSLHGQYTNTFSATLASGLVSAVGIQDTQKGMVLARVTTPDGSDVVQDWPYYVPDDFNLGFQPLEDSQGVPSRQNAKGVYVRFSCDAPDSPPVWVKLGASMQTIPEVGASVCVSRGNDESELPEIQSMVQADGSTTITDSGWTAHTQVGNSYSTSFGDSRSVRFGQPWSRADVSAAVKLVEDEYATGQYRDSSYSRGGSYGYSTSENAEKGMLSKSRSLGSTYSESWSQEQLSFSAVGSSHSESVIGKCDPTTELPQQDDPEALAAVQSSTSAVWGNSYSKSETYGDATSITTNTGTSTNRSTNNIVHNFTTTGAQSSSSAIGASNSNDAIGMSNSNSATGMSVNNSVTGVSNSNSATGMSINNSVTGVSINNSATGMSNNDSATGVSTSDSMTGVSNNNSMVGASIDVNLNGISTSNATTGMENRMSMVGTSATMSLSGESNSINITGESTTLEIAGPGSHASIKAAQAVFELHGPVTQIPAIILVL